MSFRGLPGHCGLPGAGIPCQEHSPYEKGWNQAADDSLQIKIKIDNISLQDLESFGFINGYLAYINEILHNRTLDLRDDLSKKIL